MLVISRYTEAYEDHARVLTASLDAAGMEHDVRRVPDLGNWRANVTKVPSFIWEALEEHDEMLFWVDADAEVKARLEAPEELCDLACARKWSLAFAGTTFWRPTRGAFRFLDAWCALVKDAPTNMPSFTRLVHEPPDGVVVGSLPLSYCVCSDMIEHPNPVVDHGTPGSARGCSCRS